VVSATLRGLAARRPVKSCLVRGEKKGRKPKGAVTPFVDHLHRTIDWSAAHLGAAPVFVGIALAAASALLLTLAGFEDFKRAQSSLVTSGIVAFVLASTVTFFIDRARRQYEAGRTREGTELQLAMSDAFVPILRRLAEMESRPTSQRASTFQKIIGHALQALPTLFPLAKDARMVVYRYEQKPRQKRRLVVEDSAGRSKDVPKDFVDGDGGRGSAVFAWLEKGESRFVPNRSLEGDPTWQGSGRGYKTFISVPIVASTGGRTVEIFGMLTLDAPEPGDLDETDIPILLALAALLAVAFVSAGR
jgi:hypothetical protein